MSNLKNDAVLLLVREHASDRDRHVAKLLARCDVESRSVHESDDQPAALDVLVHGRRKLISQIQRDGSAGRLEEAIREVAPLPVRFLQWVEEGISTGPAPGSGAGDGSGVQAPNGDQSSDERPQMHRDPSRARVRNGQEPRG